jgi:hypothetical protein
MMIGNISILAVPVAALAAFIVGSVWYAPPVLGKIWQKEVGLSKESIRNANMVKIFGLSFLANIVIAFGLAFFFGGKVTAGQGALFGALTGLLFVAMSIGTSYLYTQKSFKLWLIDTGYHVAMYAAAGAVIGAWPKG